MECRVNDAFILNILSPLCDLKTQCRILAERSFLKTLGGGCSAPVGIFSSISEISTSSNNEFALKVEGAVWSLNGKVEIVDKVSSTFLVQTENERKEIDEEENGSIDVSPAKRPKLSVEAIENLKKSPEVISETSSVTKDGKNVSEILNIHGKVFDVCPFSTKSKEGDKYACSEERAQTSSDCLDNRQKFDATSLPIGQDFMGECPVLSTEQKITFDTNADNIGKGLNCPIVGKSFSAPKMTSEDMDKCPFLQKQSNERLELIDYEANAETNKKSHQKSLVDEVPDMKLYCGFFCHKTSQIPAFEKCEELGIKLAQKLISAGALEVMKIAQNEIHSKS